MATQLAAQVQELPRYAVHGGVQNEPNEKWLPFEWVEPRFGMQVHGEYVVTRPEGMSGSLSAGFWRTGPTAPGATADGSHTIVYSSPLGDEVACVIDGTAVLTVLSTGKRYKVGPGSIINSPKGLEVQWEIEGPSFKKWWCIWNGSEPTSNPPQDLLISHTSDNPADWLEYHFDEPAEGPLVAGELYFLRSGGSTGTMMSGVWRSGKGIAGSDVDEKGALKTPLYRRAGRRDDPAARRRGRGGGNRHRQGPQFQGGRYDRPVFRHAHHMDVEGPLLEEAVGHHGGRAARITPSSQRRVAVSSGGRHSGPI